MKREIRKIGGLEKRELTQQEKDAGYIGALRGRIPYNCDSSPLMMRGRKEPFIEQMAPGCFNRSIAQSGDVLAFAGHTDDPVKAFARSGANLTLNDSSDALNYEALVPDTQAGRDLLELVDRGVIRGTSFEFSIPDERAGQKWEKRDGKDVRTVTDADLFTVNPVAVPAYPDSSLSSERGYKRGIYLVEADDYAWTDPDMTEDTAYALSQLNIEVCELTNALDYLRDQPTGALADYAKAEISESEESINELVAFLAKNGAEVNPASLERAKKVTAEARSAAVDTNSPQADDWALRQVEALHIAPLKVPNL